MTIDFWWTVWCVSVTFYQFSQLPTTVVRLIMIAILWLCSRSASRKPPDELAQHFRLVLQLLLCWYCVMALSPRYCGSPLCSSNFQSQWRLTDSGHYLSPYAYDCFKTSLQVRAPLHPVPQWQWCLWCMIKMFTYWYSLFAAAIDIVWHFLCTYSLLVSVFDLIICNSFSWLLLSNIF